MTPGDAVDIREGARVRRVEDRSLVGTVEAIHTVSADVIFDGDEEATRVKLDDIEQKIGRTVGTVKRVAREVADVSFEFILDEVIELRMEKLNLSWTTLSERSGLSRPTISRIARGETTRIPVPTLEALATALGVTPSRFWRKS